MQNVSRQFRAKEILKKKCMKEKVYKYSAISLIVINFITLYLFYDYFTENPAMFRGLGILMNFFRLIIFSVGLGIILLGIRLFFHLRKKTNPIKTHFLYIFSAILGANLFINWLICIFMELIKLDSMLNFAIFTLLAISIFSIIDIYKLNFINKNK